MVHCSIACCRSKDRHEFKGRKLVLFSAPAEPKGEKRLGKDGPHQNKLNNVKKCQHHAWTSAINGECENDNVRSNSPVRACAHHFDPSVVTCDDDGKHTLMVGAAPAMHLC